MSRDSCFQCKERHVGCHGSCERYLAWKKEQEKINGTDEEAWKKRDIFYDYRSRAVERNARKAKRKLHDKP